jgi:predicted amidohydrolase YtcJ
MPADYSGYPAYKNISEVTEAVTLMRNNKLQIIAHANGDKAIDQLIEAVKESRGKPYAIPKIYKYPFNFTNLDNERIVCIHCQVTRPEQIE